MVTGTLHMFGNEAHTLIDLRTTDSFISYKFVTCVGALISLSFHLEIQALARESL